MIKTKFIYPKYFHNPERHEEPNDILNIPDDDSPEILEFFKRYPSSFGKSETIDKAINRFIDSEILSENEIIDIKYQMTTDSNEGSNQYSALIIYKVGKQ